MHQPSICWLFESFGYAKGYARRPVAIPVRQYDLKGYRCADRLAVPGARCPGPDEHPVRLPHWAGAGERGPQARLLPDTLARPDADHRPWQCGRGPGELALPALD